MTTLVVGASGATGRLLVEQLLARGQHVRIVVRTVDDLPQHVRDHENLFVIQASILALSDVEMSRHVSGCDAIASCLGHTLSFGGIFGPPYRLVTHATRRLCRAVRADSPEKPVRFVLMNTTGNRNRDVPESVSFAETCVVGLLRLLLPAHADNEDAADYLREEIGRNDTTLEWAVVRPDSLLDESEVSEYSVHASPTRSVIFDAGSTSRINVGHFMAELITNDDTWAEWNGRMPVIYNW